jgi:hypothetical protein
MIVIIIANVSTCMRKVRGYGMLTGEITVFHVVIIHHSHIVVVRGYRMLTGEITVFNVLSIH